jgi:hypothetical protein
MLSRGLDALCLWISSFWEYSLLWALSVLAVIVLVLLLIKFEIAYLLFFLSFSFSYEGLLLFGLARVGGPFPASVIFRSWKWWLESLELPLSSSLSELDFSDPELSCEFDFSSFFVAYKLIAKLGFGFKTTCILPCKCSLSISSVSSVSSRTDSPPCSIMDCYLFLAFISSYEIIIFLSFLSLQNKIQCRFAGVFPLAANLMVSFAETEARLSWISSLSLLLASASPSLSVSVLLMPSCFGKTILMVLSCWPLSFLSFVVSSYNIV